MSVDDRLRQGLGANAAAFEPEVETSLDDVRRRGRRAGRAGWHARAAWSSRPRLPRPSWPSSCGPGLPEDRSPARRWQRRHRQPSCSAATGRSDAPAALAGRWGLELRGNGSVAGHCARRLCGRGLRNDLHGRPFAAAHQLVRPGRVLRPRQRRVRLVPCRVTGSCSRSATTRAWRAPGSSPTTSGWRSPSHERQPKGASWL